MAEREMLIMEIEGKLVVEVWESRFGRRTRLVSHLTTSRDLPRLTDRLSKQFAVANDKVTDSRVVEEDTDAEEGAA